MSNHVILNEVKNLSDATFRSFGRTPANAGGCRSLPRHWPGFRMTLFLFSLLLVGCQARRVPMPAKQELHVQEKCVQCHSSSLPALGKDHGKDWHYAHFWDPQLVVAGSTMPSYSSEFLKIETKLSNRAYVTPSGESVLGFAPNAFLQQRFTFNPGHYYYFIVSQSTWKNLPRGFIAFSSDILSGKQDASPVAWVPRELKEKVTPESKITILVPNDALKTIVDSFNGAGPTASQPEWLETSIESRKTFDLKRGKQVYDFRCATCHGISGNGNGPAAVFLNPKPRDFKSGEYKFKTTLSDESPTDADLFRTVSAGMKMTGMSAWNFLPAQDRWNVIAYIKKFAFVSKTRPPRHVLTLRQLRLSPEILKSRVKHGEALFFGKGKCNDCHGPGLGSKDQLPHGDGPSAFVLVDDWGYPIKPTDLAGGTLKRGNSPKEIYISVTTGLMGTPMPPYKDTLTDEECWDLSFYVSRLNRRIKQ